MSEKRFLGFTFIEGIILTVLGLCVLVLPKLTSLTFGVMLSVAFISYGIYKVVNAIINKAMFGNMFFEIFLGIWLAVIGILLLFVPNISLLWLVALTGVYFVLESISASVKAAYLKNIFNFIGCKGFVAFSMFLIGLIILLGIPSITFWMVALLSGIAFLIKGVAKMIMASVNKNTAIINNNSCCM